jgi:hypothetical protein
MLGLLALASLGCSPAEDVIANRIAASGSSDGGDVAAVDAGRTLIAASCSQTDVQAAIDQAADGDTVVVPQGTCTWGNGANSLVAPVSIGRDPATGQPSAQYPQKALNIVGAGMDKTIIIDGQSQNPHVPDALYWETNDNAPSRLSGFTFQGGAIPAQPDNNGTVFIFGTSHRLRVDNVKFIPTQQGMLHLAGFLWGVIDHAIFQMGSVKETTALTIEHDAWVGLSGSTAYGDGSWNDADSLGTERAMFVEDTAFTSASSTVNGYCANDATGSRVVYRHNTFTNCSLQGLGTDASGRGRSQRQYEIYDNQFVVNGGSVVSATASGGGTGVVFNNSVLTSNGAVVNDIHQVVTMRATTGDDPLAPWTAEPGHGVMVCQGGTGTCNHCYASARGLSCPACSTTSADTTGNVWDGNQGGAGSEGYPCLDQPGRGQGDMIVDTAPGNGIPTNQTLGSPGWPREALAPIYVWNNTINGAPNSAITINSAVPAGFIVEGRDVYSNTVRPAYAPYCYPHPLVSSIACP